MTNLDEANRAFRAAAERGRRNGAAKSSPAVTHSASNGDVMTALRQKAKGANPDKTTPVRTIRGYVAGDMPDPPPTRWLAVGWVPRAGTTVLCGDESIGKSLWWTLLAAHVTTGRPLPAVGLPTRPPAKVLLIITEDTRGEVVARLQLAGADLGNVVFAAADEDLTDTPVIPDDVPAVTALVTEHSAALVVCDGWLDTVPARLKVKDPQHAREALRPWRDLAVGTGAAALLLAHSNRFGADYGLRDRVGVTGELRKAARMLLYAAVETDDDSGRRLWVGPDKANTTARRNAVRFDVDVVQVREPTPEDDGTTARLLVAGPESTTIGKLTGRWRDAAIAARQASARPAAGDRATAWLREHLEAAPDGAAPAETVKVAARVAGIGERALDTARKILGVRAAPSRPGGPWWYTLPGGGES